ncbi:DNA methyltransferase [Escherichia coli]
MSRFIQGDCVRVMATFPGNAVDFILTDPPYLVGFRDRQGRTIAGDKTDEWLQPACNEMYRVLKKDALMVSFYGWNRIDRFMAAWKRYLLTATMACCRRFWLPPHRSWPEPARNLCCPAAGGSRCRYFRRTERRCLFRMPGNG